MVFLTRSCSASSSPCSLPRIERIERGEGLVHQQNIGVGGERAGQSDALLHAAGKLAHAAIGPLRQPDQLELLVHDALARRRRLAAQLETEADVVADRTPGQQSELLKHHGDALAAHAAQLRGVAGGDVHVGFAVANLHVAAGHCDSGRSPRAAAWICRIRTVP